MTYIPLVKKKIFYGWRMVFISAVIRFFESGTYFYGFTAFFNPIRTAFGWGAAETSIAFSLQRLESGAVAPISGFLTDRLGPKRMMIIGWIIAGAGFFAMSRVNSLWVFYASFFFLALGMSLGSYVPSNALAARWFIKKRSRAITFSALGAGIGGILIPLITMGILQFGWRTSLVIVGIAAWIVCLPLSSFVKDSPEMVGYLPDGEEPSSLPEPEETPDSYQANADGKTETELITDGLSVKETLRTGSFWLIGLVFLFQQLGTSAVFVHLIPYLESVNFPTMQAAFAVSGMAVSSVAGRLVFGVLGDLVNKRYLLTGALFLQTAGLFILSMVDVSKVWLLVVFLLIYAPGYGAPIVLRPALQADYFGVKNFGTILGLMSLVSLGGGLASPVVAGWIFDTTGGYQLAWRMFALLSVPTIPFMLLSRPPKTKPRY
ncbi:MFS transporter [Chloroflexota bacterium]